MIDNYPHFFRASLPFCGDAEGDDQVWNEHCSLELLPWHARGRCCTSDCVGADFQVSNLYLLFLVKHGHVLYHRIAGFGEGHILFANLIQAYFKKS